jgi:hypothetical protein
VADDFREKTMALEGDVLHSEMLHWHGIQTPVS